MHTYFIGLVMLLVIVTGNYNIVPRGSKVSKGDQYTEVTLDDPSLKPPTVPINPSRPKGDPTRRPEK